MDGLWNWGCFERVKRSDLPKGTSVFGSRFNYKIKRHTDTMQVKSTKVRPVVQGQRMEQGIDFEDTFTPVPRTTAAPFIQASWADLPKEIGDIYITPPKGYDEDPDYVYRIVLPLYGIGASARALHYTLARWFHDNLNGFEQAGFEESVWIRDPDARYPSHIIVSTHIDDMLCACDDLT
eukprot:3256095-Rhodomonas_salina.1